MPAKTELYDILGLTPSATPEEIRKAGKEAAIKHHPDKGGDEEMFKKTRHAVEVLMDPERRARYDATGSTDEDASSGGHGMPPDLASIFSAMGMGGGIFGGGRPGERPKTKSQPTVVELTATLEEMYNGKTIPYTFTQKRFCQKCGGSGGASTEPCKPCGGKGQVVSVRQMGPMVQQMIMPCHGCAGSGKAAVGKCTGCTGEKLIAKEKTLSVIIPPGSDDMVARFNDEASDVPGVDVAGDMIFVIKMKTHDVYKRQGANLYVERSITLKEALLGWSADIPHPSGKPVHIERKDTTQPEQTLIIDGAGMPGGGKLFVTVHVSLPTEVSKKLAGAL